MADRSEYYRQYKQNNKERLKQYYLERYENMKENILAQQKQYRVDNKDKIKDRRSEKSSVRYVGLK